MKKTYLTEEERMKIIEEEKLRNEIREKTPINTMALFYGFGILAYLVYLIFFKY